MNDSAEKPTDQRNKADLEPPTETIVFQCAHCCSIFGDTTCWTDANDVIRTISLKNVSDRIKLTDVLETSKSGSDIGSTFNVLKCEVCNEDIGKIYRTTPVHLDKLRGLFTLSVDKLIRSYVQEEKTKPCKDIPDKLQILANNSETVRDIKFTLRSSGPEILKKIQQPMLDLCCYYRLKGTPLIIWKNQSYQVGSCSQVSQAECLDHFVTTSGLKDLSEQVDKVKKVLLSMNYRVKTIEDFLCGEYEEQFECPNENSEKVSIAEREKMNLSDSSYRQKDSSLNNETNTFNPQRVSPRKNENELAQKNGHEVPHRRHGFRQFQEDRLTLDGENQIPNQNFNDGHHGYRSSARYQESEVDQDSARDFRTVNSQRNVEERSHEIRVRDSDQSSRRSNSHEIPTSYLTSRQDAGENSRNFRSGANVSSSKGSGQSYIENLKRKMKGSSSSDNLSQHNKRSKY